MRLEQTNYDNSETGCCARLDTWLWDGRQFSWRNKVFLRDHVRTFLHVPLNFGAVITRAQEFVERAEAYPENPVWLTDLVSPWRSDLYVALDREIPNVETTTLSGTFLTKVFEGPYRRTGSWMREMDAYVSSKGRELEKLYFYYATCPRCAKKLGTNHVVLFAQVQ